MKTVLIYHTCENFFASMKAALASTPLHLVHYNNYNKYALLDAMTMYRPNYVVIEKRSRLDVMELIIEKSKLIIPTSKFILLGANASQCVELGSYFTNSDYAIANEETIHHEVANLFNQDSTFYLDIALKNSAQLHQWNSLTETEKRIVGTVCFNQIRNIKDVASFTTVASYSTLRTHLKNIYKKLNVNSFNNLSAFYVPNQTPIIN